MALLLDVELALAEGVPQLNGAIPGTRDDLPVVRAERNGQDISRMTNESSCRQTRIQVPKAEGVIPGSAKSELTVGRDDNVGYEVVVAVEDSFGVAIRALVTR